MIVGEKTSTTQVVRVAVSNNFNCTKKEYKQLNEYRAAYPSKVFFVNCNVFTPRLKSLNDHPYQAVITINPNLEVTKQALSNLKKVNQDKVAFIRIKYLPAKPEINDTALNLAEQGYKVVVTPQRFNGYKTLDKYTSREYYKFSFNRHRLTAEAMMDVDALVSSHENIYHCDRSGQGCMGCKNCSYLSAGSKEIDLASINLSASGLCRFSCPDCYAKTMQHFLISCENNPIKYDVIQKNKKQKGDTKHAKHALKG